MYNYNIFNSRIFLEQIFYNGLNKDNELKFSNRLFLKLHQ